MRNHTASNQTPPKARPLRKRRFPWWALVVIILCLCVLSGAWVIADEQLARYSAFNEKRAAASGEGIHGNTVIDGIPVRGMTLEAAREALAKPRQTHAESFSITLAADDGQSWRITAEDVPMDWDTESLLKKAYAYGRRGTLDTRHQQIASAPEAVTMQSTFTYDKSAVRAITDSIAKGLVKAPVDAAVTSFDPATKVASVSDEKPGQTVDAAKLYQQVIDELDAENYGTVIQIHTQTVRPAVTRADLEAGFTKIASFTTQTTGDKNRNNNINLAAHAFDGKMIAPHGEISFNETTGERLPEKGYLEAGAIENGRTIQEYGGGVCQVSSTLFNALARAGCEIVTRKPHAWPSDYVPMGEDATVDWPRLDLVMRNPTDVPMFLTAWYEDQTVTVEVYGLALEDGMSIALDSEVTYTKKPTETVYTYNESLPVGTEPKLLKKPRTGYAVQTYRVWLKDGQEVSREPFYTSDYRMINEEYEYNDGKGPKATDAP